VQLTVWRQRGKTCESVRTGITNQKLRPTQIRDKKMKRLYANLVIVMAVTVFLIGCSGKRKELAENTTKSFFLL
jgi:hypothetical protein